MRDVRNSRTAEEVIAVRSAIAISQPSTRIVERSGNPGSNPADPGIFCLAPGRLGTVRSDNPVSFLWSQPLQTGRHTLAVNAANCNGAIQSPRERLPGQ
jgi:hypothetical protein